MNFGRLVTAMVTPFKDSGELSRDGLNVLVQHLIETGTTAIVVSGTTGESPTLSHDEKLRLLEWTLRAVDGRVPVLMGSGTNDTASSVRLSKEACQVGADGLLVVAPYYNRPNGDGMFAHFAAVAEAVSVPILLYNVPTRTSSNLDVSTVLHLAAIPNIVGVKEATPDMAQILRLASLKSDDFLLYSGDDKLTLPMLSVGGYGVVSVASHVVGREMTDMISAYLDGRTLDAASTAARLLPMFEVLFSSPSPGPLKVALRSLGVGVGGVRLPVTWPDESVSRQVLSELRRFHPVASI
jgi:4-hydroxy-tetrahydrodipicolinate synthase